MRRRLLQLLAFLLVVAATIVVLTRSLAPGTHRLAGGISLGYDSERALEDMAPAARAAQLTEMRRTGVSWVRIDAGLPVAFPKLISACLAAHLHVLLIVENGLPSAAAEARAGRVLAARYGPLGVHDYELANEPNIVQTNQPYLSPAVYAPIVRAAAAAIHAVDSGATVILGSLAPAPDAPGRSLSPATYLRDVLDHLSDGHPPFDAVGVHLYTNPVLPRSDAAFNPWGSVPIGHAADRCGGIGRSACLRTILAEHGDGRLPLWITETGAPTGPGGDQLPRSQRFQAATITQAFALANRAGDLGPAVFNFQWRDTSIFQYGLLTSTGAPKLAARAFADAVHGTPAVARLAPGRILRAGEPGLVNPDSGWALVVAAGGDLELIDAENRVRWSAGTGGHPGALARLGPSGTLVVDAADGGRLWSSPSAGAGATVQLRAGGPDPLRIAGGDRSPVALG